MKLKTDQKIYVGDRSITHISLDTMNRSVSVKFDCLSIFSNEFWTPGKSLDINECIVNFLGVTSYTLKPSGIIPNEYLIDMNLSNSSVEIIFLGEIYNNSISDYEIHEGSLVIEFTDYSIDS